MSTSALAPTLVRRSGVLVDTALVFLGVALVAACAQVSIAVPFTVVPITGQTFAVLLVGAAYGAVRGFLTLAVYLAVGLLGAPVFTGHAGGWQYLTAPTAGYLAGMLLAAGLVGAASQRGWDARLRTTLVVMVAGNVVIYAFGLLWLGISLHTGLADTVAMGLTPFLVGDLLKLVVAAGVLPLAWRLVDRTHRDLPSGSEGDQPTT